MKRRLANRRTPQGPLSQDGTISLIANISQSNESRGLSPEVSGGIKPFDICLPVNRLAARTDFRLIWLQWWTDDIV